MTTPALTPRRAFAAWVAATDSATEGFRSAGSYGLCWGLLLATRHPEYECALLAGAPETVEAVGGPTVDSNVRLIPISMQASPDGGEAEGHEVADSDGGTGGGGGGDGK